MKQMQGGAKGAMGFGKSKAKLLTEHRDKVTFRDVQALMKLKRVRRGCRIFERPK